MSDSSNLPAQETPQDGPLDDESVSGAQYALLAFLTLLNVMNFVDRQLLASFANFIVPELGLTNTQFGLLTGIYFIFFYAAVGLFMGALADMVHRPRLIAAGLALWSVLTAASGAARSFGTLALPRMFIGVGESALTPTAMSLISDRFPKSRLGFASGVYYMGVPIGVGVSLLVAGYLGPSIGWRNCFYLLGAIGVGLAVVMFFVPDARHERRKLEAANKPSHQKQSFRMIAKTVSFSLKNCPALTLTIAGGVALHFILGAAAFEQLWFAQERGFDAAHIARKTGWIGMGGGILGNLFGGWGGDWWQKNTSQGRPMFLFWLGLIFGPIGLAYRLVSPESFFFEVGIFCGYFHLGAFYGPTFSTVQELAPARIRGTVVAFYILMLNLIGLGFGITAGGITVDRLTAAGYEEPYTVTLIAFSLLSLLAIPLFFLAGRRFFADRAHLKEALIAQGLNE